MAITTGLMHVQGNCVKVVISSHFVQFFVCLNYSPCKSILFSVVLYAHIIGSNKVDWLKVLK
jgi:hypothetical protein